MTKAVLFSAFCLLLALPAMTQPNAAAITAYNEGIRLKDTDKYAAAVLSFKKAIEKYPDYKEALYQVGWCYNDKERYNDAVPYLKKAIEIDKEYVTAITELGYCDYALQNYDDALKQFDKAISIDRTELSLYYAGLCYVGLRQKINALRMYNDLKEMGSASYAEKLKKKIDGL